MLHGEREEGAITVQWTLQHGSTDLLGGPQECDDNEDQSGGESTTFTCLYTDRQESAAAEAALVRPASFTVPALLPAGDYTATIEEYKPGIVPPIDTLVFNFTVAGPAAGPPNRAGSPGTAARGHPWAPEPVHPDPPGPRATGTGHPRTARRTRAADGPRRSGRGPEPGPVADPDVLGHPANSDPGDHRVHDPVPGGPPWHGGTAPTGLVLRHLRTQRGREAHRSAQRRPPSPQSPAGAGWTAPTTTQVA